MIPPSKLLLPINSSHLFWVISVSLFYVIRHFLRQIKHVLYTKSAFRKDRQCVLWRGEMFTYYLDVMKLVIKVNAYSQYFISYWLTEHHMK